MHFLQEMLRIVVLSLCVIGASLLKLAEPDGGASLVETGYPRSGIVNLDDPPKERWINIMRLYREETIPYIERWQQILDRHTEINQSAWTAALQHSYEKDHLDEIEGILQALNHSSVTWTNLLLFQAIYELGSPLACSEAIAASVDGTLIHGRNLDYSVISPVIEITFRKNSFPLFVAPQYLGQIGLHTALKPGRWSFGQNTRHVSGDTVDSSLKRVQEGAKVYQNFVRSLMEKDLSYSDVVHELHSVALLKDMYFVVAGAGPYEGTVIDRAADPSFVKYRELSAKNNTWFLFQTNDDWDGLADDTRRRNGTSALNALSQANVNPTSIRKIMMQPPVYAQSNVVLFMMAPKSGQFCSVLSWQNNDDTSISDQCEMTGWQS